MRRCARRGKIVSPSFAKFHRLGFALSPLAECFAAYTEQAVSMLFLDLHINIAAGSDPESLRVNEVRSVPHKSNTEGMPIGVYWL